MSRGDAGHGNRLCVGGQKWSHTQCMCATISFSTQQMLSVAFSTEHSRVRVLSCLKRIILLVISFVPSLDFIG